MSKIQQHMK